MKVMGSAVALIRVPDVIATPFLEFVAHAVWRAAWAEDDPLATQEGLEAWVDAVLMDPKSQAVYAADGDSVLFVLRQIRRAEILESGPEGGELLDPTSKDRLLPRVIVVVKANYEDDYRGYVEDLGRWIEEVEADPALHHRELPIDKEILQLLQEQLDK